MHFARLIRIASIAVAALLLPSIASADGVTWRLSGVHLNDGATITGNFNYDATTNSYSAIDLSSTAGSLGGTLYTTLTPPFFSAATLLGVGPATIPGGNYANLTFLELFFTNPLTNSGGPDPLYAVEIYCANSNCSNFVERNSSSGAIIGAVATPEPASFLLLASGLLMFILLRRLA